MEKQPPKTLTWVVAVAAVRLRYPSWAEAEAAVLQTMVEEVVAVELQIGDKVEKEEEVEVEERLHLSCPSWVGEAAGGPLTEEEREVVEAVVLVLRSPRGPSQTDYRRLSGQRHRRLPVHVEGQLNSVSRLQPRRSAKPIDSPSYQSSPISTPCT